ncbi:MAG TPA: plasmid pRiA4b ORF-3 family protein [Pirellulales bacterium]|nr:plasmid pRiA4b ORF-3 family protein [Pirellulales bacterium]
MAKKTAPIYVVKVALKDAKKIWRRIALRGNQTLDDLHEAIYDAFDRYDEHLYSFFFPPEGSRSRGRNRLRDAVEYAHPYMVEDPGPFRDEPLLDASQTRIDSLGLSKGQRFEYLFDWGDEWWHELTVEEVDAKPERGRYPKIVEKHGESPPQYPDLEECEE